MNSQAQITEILNRPPAERIREYKYRFAQSTVFGLPVIALHYLGQKLGGAEAGRWAGLFQLLLAGWVIYVGTVGMLAEAVLTKRITVDGMVAVLAIGIYLVAAGKWLVESFWHQPAVAAGMFHWAVVLTIAWAGMQWTRRSAPAPRARNRS